MGNRVVPVDAMVVAAKLTIQNNVASGCILKEEEDIAQVTGVQVINGTITDNGVGPDTTIAFVDGGVGNDSITDSSNRFVANGFITGDLVGVRGSTSNDGIYPALVVNAGSVEIATGSLTAEIAGDAVTIVRLNVIRNIDQEYLVVNESGQFEIITFYDNVLKAPVQVNDKVRYQGTSSHEVEALGYNQNSTTYINLVDTVKDYPHNTVDDSYLFPFPDYVNYLSGGEVRVKRLHTSNAVGTHNFYLDKTSLHLLSLELTATDTYYPITGLGESTAYNMILDGANGTIESEKKGQFVVSINMSFTGTEDANVHLYMFKNGVKFERLGADRSISAGGKIGNVAASCYPDLEIGDILSFRMISEIPNTFVSILHANFNCHLVYPE